MHIGVVLFTSKGTAHDYVMNPYTRQEISADSIIERVMTFALCMKRSSVIIVPAYI